MGFFDRMGNLGKGLVKVWSDPENRKRERERRMAGLEAELDKLMDKVRPDGGDAGGGAAPKYSADPQQALLQKLERAFKNGILTEEEYLEKRAHALDDDRPIVGQSGSASSSGASGASGTSDASGTDDHGEPKPVKRTL